jgi:copper(I)-binding protein
LVLAGVVALFLAQVSVAPTFAADYDVGSIHISQPWSRAMPKGAKAGAGYMTITNKGTTPDKVSCVSDDASGHPTKSVVFQMTPAGNARFTA